MQITGFGDPFPDFFAFVKLWVYLLEEYFTSFDENCFSSSSDLVPMKMLEKTDLFDIHVLIL